MRQIALVMGVAALMLGACATERDCQGCSAPSTPFASTPTAGFDVLIADSDRAVTVHKGQKIEVVLTERPDMAPWNRVTTDNSAVLKEVPTGIVAPRGITVAGFQAIAVGVAAIRATAVPLCSPGQACPQLALTFDAPITVI